MTNEQRKKTNEYLEAQSLTFSFHRIIISPRTQFADRSIWYKCSINNFTFCKVIQIDGICIYCFQHSDDNSYLRYGIAVWLWRV